MQLPFKNPDWWQYAVHWYNIQVPLLSESEKDILIIELHYLIHYK